VKTRFQLADDYFALLGDKLAAMTPTEREQAIALAMRAMEWGLSLFSMPVYEVT
jgi:hypothetical protein